MLRLFKTSVFCCFIFLFCSCQQQKSTEKSHPKIIFDTDLGPDYDDVGALAMLHAYADSGLADILATMSSNRYALSGPCINVINTYFGRPDLPIGAPMSNGVDIPCSQHWTDSLVARFPHALDSTCHAQDAVVLYRRILARQPDSSVTIVTTGFLTNINNLLLSKADSISSYPGYDLVARKVKLWVAMAGVFPKGKEFNVMMDSMASFNAIPSFPRKIIFTGFEIGVNIFTGKQLIQNGSPDNPVREAFRIAKPQHGSEPNGHMSWDETAVLIAVKGVNPYFELRPGFFIASSHGSNEWEDFKNGPHSFVTPLMPFDKLGRLMEKVMMYEPSHKTIYK